MHKGGCCLIHMRDFGKTVAFLGGVGAEDETLPPAKPFRVKFQRHEQHVNIKLIEVSLKIISLTASPPGF